MNLDRATLNFLNAFPEEARQQGQQLHEDGAVVQIFGNHLFVQGRVEEDRRTSRTGLRLRGNEWEGECDCPEGELCPALYATMLERLSRGESLPEAPNEVGEKSLTEVLEGHLGRSLEDREDQFLAKLERRFRRFEIEREIYDHDLVRLHPRWSVESYEPLTLWPAPPRDIIQFWNYVAYALRKRNLDPPEFLEPITDFEWAESQLRSWEREQEVSRWRHLVDHLDTHSPRGAVQSIELRLQVSGREARLLWRDVSEAGEGEEAKAFARIDEGGALPRLRERDAQGGLRFGEGDGLLWESVLSTAEGRESGRLDLDIWEHRVLLNRLFHQAGTAERIVTLDEARVRLAEEPLRWICREHSLGGGDLELQLVTADGRDVSHVVRLLPGGRNLYLSDETVFPGPWCWIEEAIVEPRYDVPREVVESEDGVAFLARMDAELPEGLAERVVERSLGVKLEMRLAQNVGSGASEHLLVRAVAADEDDSREEVLGRDRWEVTRRARSEDGQLFSYDRTLLEAVPEHLEAMGLSFDGNLGCYKTRVTRQFPERFTEWREMLPEAYEVTLEGDLSSLDNPPVEASVSFEVVDQDIDWFDLRVVVDVDGLELFSKDIRALVAARGGYVRLEEGGWLRLRMNLSEAQEEAVSRIGLDPFDLSGETHRMHVLQLAEPMAREVFDAAAWEQISARSDQLRLEVRPSVPEALSVQLRPYQIEGFHFLAYLSANRFGGILADDMGLGKTIQGLCWMLWLREKAGSDAPPVLVVCPKSVLDVWAAEVRKAAPGLKVEVLRNRQDLDMAHVSENVDLLAINYSQLRVCAEELLEVEWLAVVLDEGQQIKNPDSKAARAARSLKARNRLVLSGTPIENRLLDVWSLMSFSMPGILGDRKYFRERFDRRKDGQAQNRLTARLRPFLLRRTKGEVALDLPPKTEEDVFCDLEEAQSAIYQAELKRIQNVLLGLESDESLRKNSFVILQGLMRLRQICCHPGLLDPKHLAEESAKMTALFYLLDQLREEGHKVLVFSQFVSMLDLIKDRLEEEDRPFAYLTGQTKDRHEVVEQFQKTQDPSVFLLSLKAGGSGLNLTAASYVVLYDPWWNPAVENQAIDRTHRIGQESKVIAYRLLVRDSVEEKIRLLQQQKRAMMTGVLGEEGFASNLKREDLDFLFGSGE